MIDTHYWCGTMPKHYQLLGDEGYVQARTAMENACFNLLTHESTKRISIITIPVVVHIVWNPNNDNNLTDEQVTSQIDALNRDFRAHNADLNIVPEAFAARVADARIEFVLATSDPHGDLTDGIVRVKTDSNEFGVDDAVKNSETGGSSAWPAEQYLNIWVTTLRGGLLGYAQFPGGPAPTDGVVVDHKAFGTCGTASAPFDLGRTTAHEIGHWLNLRHIWGDDGDGCWGSDFVEDTPNQAGPSRGVPVFPQLSCSNAPHGDLFYNFMDYSDDAVTVMFTIGQVERMDAAFTTARGTFGSQLLSRQNA